MGSMGTGSFGDYNQKDKKKCARSIVNVMLEDVALSEFYTNSKKVPDEQCKVSVRQALLNGRIVCESLETLESIGALPTKYNYLLACMKDGYAYEGTVTYSSILPIPTVKVTLDAK